MELEEQMKVWRKEQKRIASQVQVFSDEQLVEDTSNLLSNEHFKSVPLHQIFSSNTSQRIYYGGVDVSFPCSDRPTSSENYSPDEGEEEANGGVPSVAVYVILEYPTGEIIYKDHEYFRLQVPYIPSYLGFRESDPLERLINKQMRDQPLLTPNAILVDGNGVLHARKAGIACFVGVKTGIPTIGVGKTLYCEGKLNKNIVLRQIEESLDVVTKMLDTCGIHEVEQDQEIVIFDQQRIPKKQSQLVVTNGLDRGSLVRQLPKFCRGFAVPLAPVSDEVLAFALLGHGGQITSKIPPSTSHGGTKTPLYISVGHKISLQDAVCICAAFSFTRIPEPIRQADLIGRDLQRSVQKKGYWQDKESK